MLSNVYEMRYYLVFFALFWSSPKKEGKQDKQTVQAPVPWILSHSAKDRLLEIADTRDSNVSLQLYKYC